MRARDEDRSAHGGIISAGSREDLSEHMFGPCSAGYLQVPLGPPTIEHEGPQPERIVKASERP